MEEFKKIFADYDVSPAGVVRSWKSGEPVILSPSLNKKGYLVVGLSIDGERKQYRVNRLVAMAFIPNPDNKPEVNHINGDKSDNRVENLEWCTRTENERHARATGLKANAQGEDSPDAKLTNEQARFIRENPEGLTQRELAEMFDVCSQTISRIQRGLRYHNAGGLIRGKFGVAANVCEEIRRLYKKGVRGCGYGALAKKFGISQATVWRIVNRQ